MKDKLQAIHGAYKDHSRGYIVTIEDFLKYLQSREYNFALWSSWSLIWNYPPSPGWSYFEVKGIRIWELIEKQSDEVIEWFFNLLKDENTI